ncbi:MAG TPA: type II secretion system protein N [Thiobacillaceae bacterium]|nr:type II secretion system protein N [Thiobacillaceae bacterium]
MERLHLPALSGPVMFDSGARLLAVAFSVAAAVLAGRWLTELTAPRPVAELPSAPMTQPDLNLKTISRLFGTGSTQSQALEGLYLTGVFAGSRGGGFATIHTRAGDVPVFQGEEVTPGVILKQIERDRVILLSSGAQKELRLQGNAPAATPASQASPGSAPVAPPGHRLPLKRPGQPAQVEEQ